MINNDTIYFHYFFGTDYESNFWYQFVLHEILVFEQSAMLMFSKIKKREKSTYPNEHRKDMLADM